MAESAFPPPDQGIFLMHLNKGREYVQARDLTKAQAELEAAYKMRPDNDKVLNLLGTVYFKQSQYPKAKEIYRKLVERNPSAFVLHTNLGLLYFKQNQFAEAQRHLREALNLKPDYAKAHLYLGMYHNKQGELTEALQHFEAAGDSRLSASVRKKLAEKEAELKQAMGQADAAPPTTEEDAALDALLGGSAPAAEGELQGDQTIIRDLEDATPAAPDQGPPEGVAVVEMAAEAADAVADIAAEEAAADGGAAVVEVAGEDSVVEVGDAVDVIGEDSLVEVVEEAASVGEDSQVQVVDDADTLVPSEAGTAAVLEVQAEISAQTEDSLVEIADQVLGGEEDAVVEVEETTAPEGEDSVVEIAEEEDAVVSVADDEVEEAGAEEVESIAEVVAEVMDETARSQQAEEVGDDSVVEVVEEVGVDTAKLTADGLLVVEEPAPPAAPAPPEEEPVEEAAAEPPDAPAGAGAETLEDLHDFLDEEEAAPPPEDAAAGVESPAPEVPDALPPAAAGTFAELDRFQPGAVLGAEDGAGNPFRAIGEDLFTVTVEDSLLLSTGRASGYIGQLQFAKEETLRAIRASGRGKLFLSTPSQVISVLHLDQAAVCVERSRFLACQGTLAITPGQVEQPDGTGGLEYFTIAGTGYLAVATGKETILETISQHLPMTVHARAISLWTGRLAMAPPEEDLSEILGGGGAEIISVQGEGTLVIEKPFLHNN